MPDRPPSFWLTLIAFGHTVAGLVIYRESLAEIAGDRLVDAVPDHGDRAAAFWFMLAGPVLWLVARLLRPAERAGDVEAQRAAGAVLTAAGAVGSAAMPRSGFWGVLATGIALLRRPADGHH